MHRQGGNGNNASNGSGFSSVSDLAGRSPLEALQEQQRLFQEQLTALQDQQRQLQATAAVVAAQAMQQQQAQLLQQTQQNQQQLGQSQMQSGQGQSPARGHHGVNGNINLLAPGSQQTSPFIAASGASSTSAHSRPATTPSGHMGSAEPSPSYFSPLTSPALEASARFQSFTPTHAHNGSMSRQSQYAQTFPLSALSSPALNPIGSSGGANQTLSPALNPVTDGLDDPDYVRQLLGQMENPTAMNGLNGGPGTAPATGAPSQIFSPVQLAVGQSTHNHASHTSSPLVTGQAGPSSAGGAGPHRQSLPAKSRPSPLIKPTHHRHRHAGNGSMPSSPLIPMFKNGSGGSIPSMGVVPGTYLSALAGDSVAQTTSTTSTPSPVDLRDLRDIMPPPPVPTKLNNNMGDAAGGMNGRGQTQGGQAHVQPMTPAALMNMGSNPAGMGAPMGRGMGSGAGSVTVPIAPASTNVQKAGRQMPGNGNANGGVSGRNGNPHGPASAKMPIAPMPAKGRKAAIAPAAPNAQDGPSPGAAGSGPGARKGKGVKKGGRGGGAVGVRAGKSSSTCPTTLCDVEVGRAGRFAYWKGSCTLHCLGGSLSTCIFELT